MKTLMLVPVKRDTHIINHPLLSSRTGKKNQWNILGIVFSLFVKCPAQRRTFLMTMLSGWMRSRMNLRLVKDTRKEEWQWRMCIKCRFLEKGTSFEIHRLILSRMRTSLGTAIKMRIDHKMILDLYYPRDYYNFLNNIYLWKNKSSEK